MLAERTILILHNCSIFKNYMKQNKTIALRNLLLLVGIFYFFIKDFSNNYRSENWSLISLFFCFLLLLYSFRRVPIYFQQKADLFHQPDIKAYLSNIIMQNIVIWPLALTVILILPLCLADQNNILQHLIICHAMLVGWFAANLLSNLYAVKNTRPIGLRLSAALFASFGLSIAFSIFLDKDYCFMNLETPIFKFIPLLGWYLELFGGNLSYTYQMYVGSLFAIWICVYYHYRDLICNKRPSVIREHLLEITAGQKNMLSFLKLQQRETIAKGKFAAALHYKNLCHSKRTSLLLYIDWMPYLILALGIAQAAMFFQFKVRSIKENAALAQIIGSNFAFMMCNSFFWIYLLLRKEKTQNPDIYFSLIPASPRHKLNQLVRLGLIKITLPALVANLLMAILFDSSLSLVFIFILITPAIYLFKCAISLLMRSYLSIGSHGGYYTIMQGAFSLIAGLFLPSMVIASILQGVNQIELVSGFVKQFDKLLLFKINTFVEYSLYLIYYSFVYALFYAYFDKIYRKIDFGRN